MFAAKSRIWCPPSFDASVGTYDNGIGQTVNNMGITTKSANFGIVFVETYQYNLPSSVTWGGVGMTYAAAVENDNISSSGGLTMWYIWHPPQGGSTIVVTTSTTIAYVVMAAMSFANVHKMGTIASTYGYTANTTENLSVATVPKGLIVGGAGGYQFGTGPLSAFNLTQEYTYTVGSYLQLDVGYNVATSTTSTVSAKTGSAGCDYGFLGVGLW